MFESESGLYNSGRQQYFSVRSGLRDYLRINLKKIRTEVDDFADIKRGKVFVLEWLDDGENVIGYGCNAEGSVSKIVTDIKPGLFAVTGDPKLLASVCLVLGYTAVLYEQFRYEANDFSIADLLMNYKDCGKETFLVKILTPTLRDAVNLHRRFISDPYAYRYVTVPQYWSNTLLAMFERIVRFSAQNNFKPVYRVPNMMMRWFDSCLNIYQFPNPVIPIITFDIETVSTDPNRVPTGEAASDELFSVSIYHAHTNIMYSLIYLPLKTDYKNARNMILQDGYSTKGHEYENKLETFASEVALLERTHQLLSLPEDRLHYLIGYNSLDYDMPYLLCRCVFYRLSHLLDKYVYRDGIMFGLNQIHLDAMRMIITQHSFKSYKLGLVCNQLLNSSKTDTDAVALRYTFHWIRSNDKYIKHDECVKFPSVRDIILYNNRDTILVAQLQTVCRTVDLWLDYIKRAHISLTEMNVNYDKVKFKLWNLMFVTGLSLGVYLGTFKSTTYSFATNIASFRLDLSRQLWGARLQLNGDTDGGDMDHSATTSKGSFPGGANYCKGEEIAHNVQVYDYKIAYPLLIDRMNISDETAEIVPANILLMFYDNLTPEQRQEFVLRDYMTHNGSTKAKTIALYHQYVYQGHYCGDNFPFEQKELERRNNAPVVVIWQGRRGVLSRIVKQFNIMREDEKMKKNQLTGLLDVINQELQNTENEEMILSTITNTVKNDDMEVDNDDDGAFEFSDDDENDNDDAFKFNDNDEEESKSDSDDDDFKLSDVEIDPGIDVSTVKESAPVKEPVPTTTPVSTNMSRDTIFQNNLTVQMYITNTLELDTAKVNRLTIGERKNVYRELITLVEYAIKLAESTYRLLKIIINSVYGCTGTAKNTLAALITYYIRSTIIASGRKMVEWGMELVYMDTDSLFVIVPDGTPDLSNQLNSLFPHTTIAMKLYKTCMFVQKKTYYTITEDDELKYFQNHNGSPSWHEFVQFIYKHSKVVKTNRDIYNMFIKFYHMKYNHFFAYERMCEDLQNELCQMIRLKSEYKTNTPRQKVKQYLIANYPALATSNKLNMYYEMGNDIKEVVLRPMCDLVELRDLVKVNLYKFYQNVFRTVYNIINMHIKANNHPIDVQLTIDSVTCDMMNAFLDVRAARFPNNVITGPRLNELQAIDVYIGPGDSSDSEID